MKKAFIIAVVIIAALAAFLGCGKEKADNQSVVTETTTVALTEATTEEVPTTQSSTESSTTYEEYLNPTDADGNPMARSYDGSSKFQSTYPEVEYTEPERIAYTDSNGLPVIPPMDDNQSTRR